LIRYRVVRNIGDRIRGVGRFHGRGRGDGLVSDVYQVVGAQQVVLW
jgi:hypothetical protein